MADDAVPGRLNGTTGSAATKDSPSIFGRFTGDVVAVLVASILTLTGVLAPIHEWLVDSRFAATGRPASGEIVLVAVDPDSLDAVGVWPWPRRVYADAIDRLVEAGAAEISFDIDFSQASNEADDLIFEDALERAGGMVVLPAFQQARNPGSPGDTVITRPLERFERHVWLASVNVSIDADGYVRRIGYGDDVAEQYLPSFASLLGGGSSEVGTFFRVDFGIDPATIPTVSFADLLAGKADDMVRGRKVLIGATAVELKDYFTVPGYGTLSGPALQILGAESILQGRALRETSTLFALLAIGALFVGSITLRARWHWGWRLAALFAASASVECAAYLVQDTWPIISNTAPVHVAAILFAVATLFHQIDVTQLLLRISNSKGRRAQTILERVVADSFSGIVVADGTGTIQSVNDAARAILRLDDDKALAGGQVSHLLPPAVAVQVFEACKSLEENGSGDGTPEIHTVTLGDERVVLETVVTPSRLPSPDAFNDDERQSTIACITFSDITQKHDALEKLDRMAFYDSLTGLPNRNRLHVALQEAITRYSDESRPFIAVIFDLVRFKNVNDTLGHRFGDMLLTAVGDRCACILPSDATLARYGGDEFVAIVPNISDRNEAANFAADLVTEISEPYDLEGHRAIVGARAGIVIADDSNLCPETIISNADLALHHVKDTEGVGIAFYSPQYGETLRDRREIELELFQALDRREFEVFYQPQIDFRTGAIEGAEALIRWRHPVRGLVRPDLFIPVLEDVGLVANVGRWILEQSCIDAAGWRFPVRIAVNLSTKQFQTDDLVRTVEDCLSTSGLAVERLDLEVTESILAEDTQAMKQTIDSLQRLGVGLALDDFGTGYSALSYIHQFPFSKIKIDRAFIDDLPQNATSQAIVHAVVSMAGPLGMCVIAEGIENEEQATMARLAGCALGQGYLYGKPMPNIEFQRLLDQWPAAA